MTPSPKATVPSELHALRDELSALDASLVELLRRRLDIARRVGAAKRAAKLPTLDPRREAKVVSEVARRARQSGLPEEAVRDIFWPIVAMCRRAQQEDAP